jgi:hypothetical protein
MGAPCIAATNENGVRHCGDCAVYAPSTRPAHSQCHNRSRQSMKWSMAQTLSSGLRPSRGRFPSS